MPTDPQVRLETSSVAEIERAVSRIYCPHLTTLAGQRHELRASFRIMGSDSQPIVELRYGTPVKVDAGHFPPADSTSVTAVAMENGFVHLPRFSSYYRAAFGETPLATLRRNRRNVARMT